MRFIKNDPWFKKIRQDLRTNSTEPEKILWEELKGKRLGVKFRRQYSFGNYIMDFYSPEIKLGIEIDGPVHNFQKDKDEYRTRTLNLYGIEIVRFTNMEILNNLDSCLQKLKVKVIPYAPPKLRGAGGEV